MWTLTLVFTLLRCKEAAAKAKTCKLGQSQEVAWTSVGKNVAAQPLSGGAPLNEATLPLPGKACPKVLQAGPLLWVLGADSWLLLSPKGTVLDKGPWHGETASIWKVSKGFWMMEPPPGKRVFFLNPDEKSPTLVEAKDVRLAPFDANTSPIVLPGGNGQSLWYNQEALYLASDYPVGRFMIQGELLLSNRSFGKGTVGVRSVSKAMSNRDWDWKVDLESPISQAGLVAGDIVLLLENGQSTAFHLDNGMQAHWPTPFDFTLNGYRVRPKMGKLELEDESSGAPMPFDALISLHIGEEGMLDLYGFRTLSDSPYPFEKWEDSTRVQISTDKKGQGGRVALIQVKTLKIPDVGNFQRPQQSTGSNLPFPPQGAAFSPQSGLLVWGPNQVAMLFQPNNIGKPQAATWVPFSPAKQ